MNLKDALAEQDMIKSASPATSSLLGPRASRPHNCVITHRRVIELFALRAHCGRDARDPSISACDPVKSFD